MSRETRIRCLAVGHVTHDRYGDDLAVGGSALYAARTWRGLGAVAGIATAVGPDFAFSDTMADVEVFTTPSPHTTTFENSYTEGHPRVMRVEHPAAPPSPEHLPGRWRAPDVMFLAPVVGELALGMWIDAVDAEIIGVGLQGFLKEQGPVCGVDTGQCSLRRKRFEPTDEALSAVSAVFLSEEDVTMYGDGDLLSRLRRSVALVVLTRGEAGARLFLERGVVNVGVRETVVVDPTGAGDTFAAASLFALATGGSPEEAAKLGAAAASIVVEGRGPETLDRMAQAFSRRDAIEVHGGACPP